VKPQKKTIRAVVEYLEEQGLNVYGPCVDLDTGYRSGPNMDYDADAVEKYLAWRKLHGDDFPFDDEEEDDR
jgi:hypothetical protein